MLGKFSRLFSLVTLIAMGVEILMRFGIITSLFIIFSYNFAWPSFKKYMEAGVITEKSWRSQEATDWPSLTFCRYDNATGLGWKNTTHVYSKEANYSWTWTEQFCEEAKTIDETLACIHKETYNLSEKIVEGVIEGKNVSDILVNKDSAVWSEDLTQAPYLGKENI